MPQTVPFRGHPVQFTWYWYPLLPRCATALEPPGSEQLTVGIGAAVVVATAAPSSVAAEHSLHASHWCRLQSLVHGRVLLVHQGSHSVTAEVVVEHSPHDLQFFFLHNFSHGFVLVEHQDLHAKCAHSLHWLQLCRLHNWSHVLVLVEHQSWHPVESVVVVSHWGHPRQFFLLHSFSHGSVLVEHQSLHAVKSVVVVVVSHWGHARQFFFLHSWSHVFGLSAHQLLQSSFSLAAWRKRLASAGEAAAANRRDKRNFMAMDTVIFLA